MSKVLVIAELDGHQLNPSTAKCIACASQLAAAAIDVIVFSDQCGDAATAAATIAGVSRVLTVESAQNKDPLAAVLAPQAVSVAADYDYVFGPSTTFGKDLMPRIAALLGIGQVSDIMTVESPRSFTRPVYAGNAILTVDVPEGRKIVATVRTASWKEAPAGGSAVVESISWPGRQHQGFSSIFLTALWLPVNLWYLASGPIPILEKGDLQTLNCWPLDPHVGVAPLAEAFVFAEIFNADIMSAGKANPAVDNDNFTMVAEI
jgi:hypothetical protein